jgi:hypothetical protein
MLQREFFSHLSAWIRISRGARGMTLWPWSFMLTSQGHDEQQQWLDAELAKPCTTPFLEVAAHHPLYRNGQGMIIQS